MMRRPRTVLAAFYVVATIIMALEFGRSSDRTLPVLGHWLALYAASVILPAWWTATLLRRLEARGVVLGDLQVAALMPAACAIVAALIALQL